MPVSAWVEIHDLDGNLLETIQSEIAGGSVNTWLPSFGPGSRGILTMWMKNRDGSVDCNRDEDPVDLANAVLLTVQMG